MPDLSWLAPRDAQQLTRFYFILCIAYLAVHLIWDAVCKDTPPFSLDKLQYKMNEVYSSSTFATSAFFIVILFDMKNPLRTSDAFIFPLIIAALTGFMISLSAIVPKKVNNWISPLCGLFCACGFPSGRRWHSLKTRPRKRPVTCHDSSFLHIPVPPFCQKNPALSLMYSACVWISRRHLLTPTM